VPKRSPFTIDLNAEERSVLERRAARYTAPYREVVRAKIVLMAAQGSENKQIAAGLSLPVQIVSKWRKRFFEEGLAGLEERSRGGRPTAFSPTGRR
jgi:transposase